MNVTWRKNGSKIVVVANKFFSPLTLSLSLFSKDRSIVLSVPSFGSSCNLIMLHSNHSIFPSPSYSHSISFNEKTQLIHTGSKFPPLLFPSLYIHLHPSQNSLIFFSSFLVATISIAVSFAPFVLFLSLNPIPFISFPHTPTPSFLPVIFATLILNFLRDIFIWTFILSIPILSPYLSRCFVSIITFCHLIQDIDHVSNASSILMGIDHKSHDSHRLHLPSFLTSSYFRPLVTTEPFLVLQENGKMEKSDWIAWKHMSTSGDRYTSQENPKTRRGYGQCSKTYFLCQNRPTILKNNKLRQIRFLFHMSSHLLQNHTSTITWPTYAVMIQKCGKGTLSRHIVDISDKN